MIERGNFREALGIMGFTAAGKVYTYGGGTWSMSADFGTGTLSYPEAVRGREHNTSFTAPENFVVFECVFRLLTKGYRPEDIELEKEWRLGHEQKGGRADICVYKKDSDEVLMIIECKTAGREYEKARKDTRNDGGQLFSYWQQEISAQWLVLYTSDIRDGEIKPEYIAVSCEDDPNLLNRYRDSGEVKLYVNAHTAEEKFTVWRETYNLEASDSVIFSEDSAAYDIRRKPLRLRDLRTFTTKDKEGIVNAFEEILRHNNVSDKENAFNRLIALFICKLADEITKGENDELAFQYIQRRDNYEELQDRLQRLYTRGMMEFMKEDITYISADYPRQFMTQYSGGDRAKAIRELSEAFRKLKYFTNNDFAFLDVHNEELFYKNGKILVEVVQLFQPFRIVRSGKEESQPGKEHLLGDLFEQLLDHGFRQNEGQFFTPVPIARFIWDSLPVKRFKSWPRVIDYACGAGHFLTEAIEAVNHFIPSANNSWTRDCVYGIEKDYRLARVSKVSMFMNGAGDSNIIFGDGLEDSPDSGIKPGTFDILTANPPYSVQSFMQHIDRKLKEGFTLADKIGVSGSEIEVLFVERIGQLLNDNGLAAVILPSSLLSNNSACYTGAREEILRTFRIRAVVNLGSKTFGATGTNTVIFFLERYLHHPPRTCHVSDSVDAIFAGRDLRNWEDEDILAGYLAMQGLTHDEWDGFIHRSLDRENMPEYFRMYLEAYGEDFYGKAVEVEREKVFYYGLTYTQRTVVILAPSDNAGQKEFLGYDWSNRKGLEGIQYVEPRGGKMYVNADREAEGTLADVVRQSFGDGDIVMTEDNMRYARVVETWRMLDFGRERFNAAIRLQEQKGVNVGNKYSPVKLLSVCMMNVPKSEAKEYPPETLATFIDMASVSISGKITARVDRPIGDLSAGSYVFFREGDIICAKMMTSAENMKCTVAEGLTNGIGFGSSEFYTFRCGEKIMTRYVCEFLNMKTVRDSAWASVTGSGRQRVPSSFYEALTIPLPPMEIQAQIVNECAEIDSQESALNARITSCREKIDDIFSRLDAMPGASRFTLGDKRAFTLAIGKRVLNSQLVPGGKIPVYSANVREPFGYVDELLRGFEDFGSDSVLWGIDGDFMVSFMERGQEFYPTDHCGVLRVLTDRVHPRYMAHVLEREGTHLGFSRNFRASLDRVGGIRFAVPDIESQVPAMIEVLSLEGEISRALGELEGLAGMKEGVLRKYLG
ncbi:MAG: N-6 DNA methylase [Synergistaceae bacterium]|nr:N-6 DNA methylase [Synergistaceae bacterium]